VIKSQLYHFNGGKGICQEKDSFSGFFSLRRGKEWQRKEMDEKSGKRLEQMFAILGLLCYNALMRGTYDFNSPP
jgi:hypothetical protein